MADGWRDGFGVGEKRQGEETNLMVQVVGGGGGGVRKGKRELVGQWRDWGGGAGLNGDGISTHRVRERRREKKRSRGRGRVEVKERGGQIKELDWA